MGLARVGRRACLHDVRSIFRGVPSLGRSALFRRSPRRTTMQGQSLWWVATNSFPASHGTPFCQPIPFIASRSPVQILTMATIPGLFNCFFCCGISIPCAIGAVVIMPFSVLEKSLAAESSRPTTTFSPAKKKYFSPLFCFR